MGYIKLYKVESEDPQEIQHAKYPDSHILI